MIEIITKNPSQTKKAAKELAFSIKETRGRKTALVLALEGDLGSGKTTFIQGLAKGLVIRDKILSPTFVVFKKFQIPITKSQINSKSQLSKFKTFYHLDCYRIGAKDLLGLGLKDILIEPRNLVVIEWAEKIKKILPKNTLWIKFKHLDEKSRKINFCLN